MDWLAMRCGDPLLKVDKAAVVLEANPAFYGRLGVTGEVVGKPLSELLPGLMLPSHSIRVTYLHNNKLFLIDKSPADPLGHHMLLFHDRGDEGLLRVGQKMALDSIAEGVIIVDHKCRIVYYNKSQLDFDGLSNEEIIGRTTYELENISPADSGLMQVLETGEPTLDYEHHFNTRLGRYVTMEGKLSPLHSGDKLLGAVGVYQRISTFDERIHLPGWQRNTSPKDSKKTKKLYTFDDILGNSPDLVQCVKIAKAASNSDSSVFIYGETGVGKELFTQSIHSASSRNEGPFIALNCSAVPEGLFESMLFGSTKGAFTGSENTQGLLEMADGGTILLDEINSMPIYLQNKLLRALEEKSVRPLGSDKEIDFDVRIISCSTENPEIAVANNSIRRDLYYRLAVVVLEIPSLRHRTDDILLYARAFITNYNNLLGKAVTSISQETANVMQNYAWPGNVRQLRHYVECIMNALPESGAEFNHRAMPSYFRALMKNQGRKEGSQAGGEATPETPDSNATAVSHDAIDETLNGAMAASGAGDAASTDTAPSRAETTRVAMSGPADNAPPSQAVREEQPGNQLKEQSVFDYIKSREKDKIINALIQCEGNISKTAQNLGITRRSLHYKIKKYGLK